MKRAPFITTLCIAIAIVMYYINPYPITGIIAGASLSYLIMYWVGRLLLKKAVERRLEK